MKNAMRFGTLAMALAAAGAVSAQAPLTAPPASRTAPVEFGSVDQNKDGRVSLTEAQSNNDLRAAFTGLDANRDTYLTPAEFSKWNNAGKSKSRNADGAITDPQVADPQESTGARPIE